MSKKFVLIYFSCFIGVCLLLIFVASIRNNSDSATQALNAKQIQACEKAHNMKSQNATVRGDQSYLTSLLDSGENLDNAIQDYNNSNAPNLNIYEFCNWPPRNYSDSDGFSQIQEYSRTGPGLGEASDATQADVFDPQCNEFSVTYQITTQGNVINLPDTIIKANEITSEDGGNLSQAQLNFYPGIGESIFLRNDKAELQNIFCLVDSLRNAPHSTFSLILNP